MKIHGEKETSLILCMTKGFFCVCESRNKLQTFLYEWEFITQWQMIDQKFFIKPRSDWRRGYYSALRKWATVEIQTTKTRALWCRNSSPKGIFPYVKMVTVKVKINCVASVPNHTLINGHNNYVTYFQPVWVIKLLKTTPLPRHRRGKGIHGEK